MIYEENGRIIVDELRPMSEVKDGDRILVKMYKNKYLYEAHAENGNLDIASCKTDITYFEGWIPLIEYRRKE